MLRIRYEKTIKPEVLTSVKTFSSVDGKEVRVFLNCKNYTYGIFDMNSDATVASGTAKSLHKTKIAAKKALQSLGIDFGEEKRERKVETTVANPTVE